MVLSTPKKVVFCLIAILLPLLIIEFTSYAVVRIFFPRAYAEHVKIKPQKYLGLSHGL